MAMAGIQLVRRREVLVVVPALEAAGRDLVDVAGDHEVDRLGVHVRPAAEQGRTYSCPEDVLKPVPERKRTYRADGTWS